MNDELTKSYNAGIRNSDLRRDAKQETALISLSRFSSTFPPVDGRQQILSSWRRAFQAREAPVSPLGIYLFGGVGRGKTMLMDMFFVSVQSPRKRRVHFHTFMLEVHRWMHSWRQDAGRPASLGDPIPVLARELSSKIDLLCFDEFEIHDVADALIMRRIFSGLLDSNVRIVMTSNWHPEELYLGGLQREMFIPFINYLKEKLEIIPLGNGTDCRLLGLRSMPVYFSPLNENTRSALEAAFRSLTGGADSIPEEMVVEGRQLRIGRANQGIAWLSFKELCEQPVGSSDYLAIIARFHTLMMPDIPIMLPQHRNEARRFAVLVDMLYDHNVKLVCSAAGAPEELYTRGTGSREFRRTSSRLREMQTAAYLSRSHGLGKT